MVVVVEKKTISKSMRGGFNEEFTKVLDDALNATSGGAHGARLNGGQGGGSRRRPRKQKIRRALRSMSGVTHQEGPVKLSGERHERSRPIKQVPQGQVMTNDQLRKHRKS